MLQLEDFQRAHQRILPEIIRTPTSFDLKSRLIFKWENHQPTRSFKVRGALNKILSMEYLPEILITGSAGNHGQAVALAAQKTGVRARVFVPENTPKVKTDRMLALGAEVVRVPGLYGDAEARALREAGELGMPFISPYNDSDVIAGAGTIAIELLDSHPELKRILVPVGGGGLICGVGLAAKAINPAIEVIGVLSEASPYLYRQYYFGDMDEVEELPTLTDGLAGAVQAGSITIDWLHAACDGIIQVTEAAVAQSIVYLHTEFGETVEGSGAVGLAAVLANALAPGDIQTAAIISGGNIDNEVLDRLLNIAH